MSDCVITGTEQKSQLIVNNLDDLMSCIDTSEDLGTYCFLFDCSYEAFSNSEVDVCFQEGETDLFERGL